MRSARTYLALCVCIALHIQAGVAEPASTNGVQDPKWLPGYKVRYHLRIIGDPVKETNQTVIASIPTGGWLKPDISDLVVVTSSNRKIPVAILAHDVKGDTIVQFRRNGNDKQYWVYAANPQAPDKDVELVKKIDTAKKASEQALRAKMAAMKESAKRAVELRDISAKVDHEKAIASKATKALEHWNAQLPILTTAATAAAAKVPPAKKGAENATKAHAPFEKDANEKTALARKLTREADAARSKADKAASAYQSAVNASEAAKIAAEQARKESDKLRKESGKAARAAAEARKEADAAKAEADAAQVAATKAEASGKAMQAAEAASTKKEQTAKTAAEKARVLPKLKAEKIATDKEAVPKENAAKKASEKAKAVRLAAAPTAAAKDKANKNLAQLTTASEAAAAAVVAGRKRIAAETETKTEAEKKLAELEPRMVPVKAAADQARLAADQALAHATTKEKAYFDLAYEADPRLFKEGLTVEFREWAGDELSSWRAVVEGLHRSDNILGNAVVAEVIQNINPFRRNNPRNFAASYRGYLKVDKPGIYSFFVNGDDTTFLFMNGYKVYSRTGTNKPLSGHVPLYSIGADIQLEAGVHPFEVHHIVGNTPGARGLCNLVWLMPGAKQWQLVPRSAFTTALTAVPVEVEAFDGRQVAVTGFGMDDTLTADGVTLYLTRFEAQGKITQPSALKWNFGDGLTGSGRSCDHVYFSGGDYDVTLRSHPKLPPFRRRCNVWVPPTVTGPHSLAGAIRALDSIDIAQLNVATLNDVFHFLLICEQPTRWPVMERLCRHMLKKRGLDIKYRAHLCIALMESMAQQGRGADGLDMVDEALLDVGRFRTLRALILLGSAKVNWDYLKDFREANRLYSKVIDENLRLRHPLIRQAAVTWGDMSVVGGDLARAGKAYRLARSLGGIGSSGEGQTDPVERGALLRVAEQQLRGGNIRQTHRLLERIESEFPEQKLEGLYRFLRGESERHAGRYEESIWNYEVLLQLQQWAGYRASALFGIADDYYRMGKFDKAMDWIAELKESFPDYYAEKKLDNYETGIQKRQEKLAALAEGQSTNLFTEFHSGFEPGEYRPTVNGTTTHLLSSLGIESPHTLLVDARHGRQNITLQFPALENIPSQGSLWVEFWYRDTMAVPGSTSHRHIVINVVDDNKKSVGRLTFYPQRTFGQWHKAMMAISAPRTLGGSVEFSIQDTGGIMEIDGVQVLHVTDRQRNALQNFIEGADPQ